MAQVDFTVTRFNKSRGSASGTISSSHVRLSGQDAITTVENLEDASGDITLAAGDVLTVHASAAIRIRFGGVAATGTTGHYVPAAAQTSFEIERGDEGTVSVIEAT